MLGQAAIWLVFVCLTQDSLSSAAQLKSSIPMSSVHVLVNRTAELPCNTTPSDPHDEVILVLWFREDLGTPIFSADARDVPLSQALVWYDDGVLKGRATFKGRTGAPSILALRNVTLRDGSIYRCRVDFREAKSRNARVNLTVIDPATNISVMLTRTGEKIAGSAGPFRIGDRPQFTCVVEGGVPRPKVMWKCNGEVMADVKSEYPAKDPVRSVMVLGPLRRSHWPLTCACLATNSNSSRSLETAFLVDMELPPYTVSIQPGDKNPTLGKPFQLPCHVTGSRPAPLITWWRHGTSLDPLLQRQIISESGNLSTSLLNITLFQSDMGDHITCRAVNPNMDSSVIETTWIIDLWYAPNVTLMMGRSLKATGIKAGDDVYFDCIVDARPPLSRIEWKNNGMRLMHNVSAGIIMTNQSLVLQNVARSSAGNITCAASNAEGYTESRPILLDIKYVPVCKTGLTRYFGVSRGENVEITCQVEANPGAELSYKWFFNNSAEIIEVPRSRFTTQETVSVLTYRPVTPLDYGTLLCYATNAAGMQVEPCLFHILTAGPPEPVFNCTISNHSAEAILISCQPGFHGGLPQNFTLNFYSDHNSSLILEYKMPEPTFLLSGLKPNTRYRALVSAFNAKGKSDDVVLEISTVKEPERQLEVKPEPVSTNSFLTPTLGILSGVVVLLCIGGVSIGVFVRKHCRRRDDATRATEESPGNNKPTASQSEPSSVRSSSLKPLIQHSNSSPEQQFSNRAWPQSHGGSSHLAALQSSWPVGEPPPNYIMEGSMELHNPDIIPPPLMGDFGSVAPPPPFFGSDVLPMVEASIIASTNFPKPQGIGAQTGTLIMKRESFV